MPVISFVSPKGGAGKSTSALLLATELARKGIAVTIIDSDPETWISDWSQKPDCPANITIVKRPSEETIIDEIETATQRTPFVIVDLEGTANMLVAFAISRSDLVIIPMQPSYMDGKSAAKAVQLIKQQERAFSRKIPFGVLLARTKATIRTRTQSSMQEQLAASDIPVFQTELLEREAFRLLFDYGGTLESLPKNTYKLGEAIENARAFAGEVVTLLKSVQAPTKRSRATAA